MSPAEQRHRADVFYRLMETRRSVRDFSARPVPRDLIGQAVRTASTAPSGAHLQPWTFVAVSDAGTKRRIREAAEREEYEGYHSRMSAEWVEALEPLFPVGYPAEDATVPELQRKPLAEVAVWVEDGEQGREEGGPPSTADRS